MISAARFAAALSLFFVDGREIQRTLMELLNQLDGFEDLGQVKMVMATNRPGKSSTGERSYSYYTQNRPPFFFCR